MRAAHIRDLVRASPLVFPARSNGPNSVRRLRGNDPPAVIPAPVVIPECARRISGISQSPSIPADRFVAMTPRSSPPPGQGGIPPMPARARIPAGADMTATGLPITARVYLPAARDLCFPARTNRVRPDPAPAPAAQPLSLDTLPPRVDLEQNLLRRGAAGDIARVERAFQR